MKMVNKIFSALLSLIFLLNGSLAASLESGLKPFSEYGTFISFTNDNGAISYEYELNSSVENVHSYLAVYDNEDGRLAYVSVDELSGSMNLDGDKDYSAKLLLWDKDTARPISIFETGVQLTISGQDLTTTKIPVQFNLTSTGAVKPVDTTAAWSVSDSSVATINATGLLTPLRAGVVDVIAISDKYNETISKTINIVEAVLLTPPLTSNYSASGSVRKDMSQTATATTTVDFRYLFNGRTDAGDRVMLTKPRIETLGTDYYFDMIFETPSMVEYLEMWAMKPHIGSQEPSEVRIDYLDQATQQWKTMVESYNLLYNDGEITNSWTTGGDHVCRISKIPVNMPVRASVVRVFILNANRNYEASNFGIVEMLAFGASGGTESIDGMNLLTTKDVIITNPDISEVDFQNLNDGNFGTAFSVACPTASANAVTTLANPYTIEFDFGTKQYSVNAMQLFSKREHRYGIVEAYFEYYDGTNWVAGQALKFERYMYNTATLNSSLDYVNFINTMTANKFRLVITKVKSVDGRFEINELALYSNRANVIPEVSEGNVAAVPFPMDSSNQSGWWSPLETHGEYAYLAYNSPGSREGTHYVKVGVRDGDGNWTEMTCMDENGNPVEYTDDIGHAQPSIARDGDGYLHVFAGMHGEPPWQYLRSATPGGPPIRRPGDMPAGDPGMTYPVVASCPKTGDIYLISRGDTTPYGNDYANRRKDGYFYRWDNSDDTWSKIAIFAGDYAKAVYTEDVQVDSAGDVHLLFSWSAYPSSALRHEVSYLKYSPANGKFSTADGTNVVALPVTPSTPNLIVQPLAAGEKYVHVYDGQDPGGQASQSSKMAIGEDNKPHIAYRYREGNLASDVFRVRYAYHDNDNGWQWQTVYSGARQTKAALGVTWTGTNVRVYYVFSSDVNRVVYKDNSTIRVEDNVWLNEVSVAPGKPIERMAVKRNRSKDILYLVDVTNRRLYYGETR